MPFVDWCVLQPVGEIASKLWALERSSTSAKILLHTDASQAIGKIPVDVQELGVNFLTITGHKVCILTYNIDPTRLQAPDLVFPRCSQAPAGGKGCGGGIIGWIETKTSRILHILAMNCG